jgi:hypothetical protein
MFLSPYAISSIATERLAALRQAALLANMKKTRP